MKENYPNVLEAIPFSEIDIYVPNRINSYRFLFEQLNQSEIQLPYDCVYRVFTKSTIRSGNQPSPYEQYRTNLPIFGLEKPLDY